MNLRRLVSLVVFFAVLAVPAAARIISYAPYTDRTAVPAVQHRLNRYFVLFELSPQQNGQTFFGRGQVVIYDSTGADEPRVVFGADGTTISVTHVAAREDNGTLVILLRYLVQQSGGQRRPLFALSNDSGATWKTITLPEGNVSNVFSQGIDRGGPIARERHSQVRIGTARYPFYVGIDAIGVYAIGIDGTSKLIAKPASDVIAPLMGTDRDGNVVLVRMSATSFSLADARDGVVATAPLPEPAQYEGWTAAQGVDIASYDSVYLQSQTKLYHLRRGQPRLIAEAGPPRANNLLITPPIMEHPLFFAIPTADYTGAWIVQRDFDQPTILWRHVYRPNSVETGKVKQWEDPSRPEVEALHAARSSEKLLIQVHRPRTMADQRLFLDPALAVWRVGDPAPAAYDELFMNEAPTKGFVHLDVDKIENGEPFVFDSGISQNQAPPPPILISPPPPSSGGGDVIQEWGVVRASLRQQLVLPGIGRTRGAYGSDWSSDIILQNPMNEAQRVRIRYAPTGATVSTAAATETAVVLAPREIRRIPDALRTLFGLENGSGAFYLTPAHGITAASRTYTRTSRGTYGFNMNAIDIFTAASPRFPVSFSGAFPGANFRTNLVLTDAAGAGSVAAVAGVGFNGPMGANDVAFEAPPGGQSQFNDIGSTLRLDSRDAGGLVVRPSRGFVIPSVYAIDNRSNDPTYFPPDLPAPIVRTIPVIGHVAGANNSNFRSDLYLYNPSQSVRSVALQVKSWTTDEQPVTVNITLLPNEARVIPDALRTLFGKTGLARLRYFSAGDASGVRVTSRTYSVDENGATYGFLMPPLNNFQYAGPGDTLEILGTVPDPERKFRTNVGLVDTAAFATGSGAIIVNVEIVGNGGAVLSRSTAHVPSAGGMQLNDIFASHNVVSEDPVLIRISPVNGVIGAFASTVDNGTNDPSYIAANLAAQQ